ncbi:MAG: nickel pincer cofactor biosynthesis protein LarC [Nitrospiraceae bacterium]|nr:nickel pincer cofactor biosynthesis protein LarC [Nitrospiraceae bacterium]
MKKQKQKQEQKSKPASGKKILWLDCSSGISGDMFIGAGLSAGVSFKRLESELLGKMPLKNVRIGAREVRRMGLSATRFEVKEPASARPFSWDAIRGMVKESALPEDIREAGLLIIKSLFDAEAKIHGMKSAGEVHLHELGSADTIVDVFGALICLKLLKVEEVYSSPVNLGGGTVDTRHGRLPVPAPATALLLQGAPVYGQQPPPSDESPGGSHFELTTPTGAALIKGLAKGFSPMPCMRLAGYGSGAGRMDFKDSPNVLRAFVGEKTAPCEKGAGDSGDDGAVLVIETNIDDMNPQIYGHLMERLFKAGALDVFLTPVIMKKNRPAIKITCLCVPGRAPRLKEIIFSETTTLGVRFHRAGRQTLPRETEVIETEFGPVRFKTSFSGARGRQVPEYEDCLKAARKTGLPLREVMERLRSVPATKKAGSV